MNNWKPSIERRTGSVTLDSARQLHDLLDRDGAAPELGDELPILWQWLSFLPAFPQAQMGQDGHPRTGAFLPPVGDRRRMYAGGKVISTGQIRVAQELARTSQVSHIAEKDGRSGQLLFVTVDHELTSPSGAMNERNDIVYKSASTTAAERAEDDGIDVAVIWGARFAIDPTVLFRFSALTYNAHRIHYDREYTTKVEGYPGLVVHGPLQAILLGDAARRAFPDKRVTSFEFRSTAPAFDDHALELRVRNTSDPNRVELAAYSGGIKTMTATAELESLK